MYQKLSPVFAELYYNTFKKIIERSQEEQTFAPGLTQFLQGIQLRDDFEVVDSNKRCKLLKEIDMKNASLAEIEDWMLQASEPTRESESEKIALALLVEPSGYWSEEGSWLWTLMQGKRPNLEARTSVNLALNTNDFYGSGLSIKLHVRESYKGWFIIPFIDDELKGSPVQREALAMLLPLESFRQQLDEGKGICCPNYTPERCMCEIYWRESLWRLLQWAREGKFGDGEWRDLPPEGSCGD
jgi:hypothetical protein